MAEPPHSRSHAERLDAMSHDRDSTPPLVADTHHSESQKSSGREFRLILNCLIGLGFLSNALLATIYHLYLSPFLPTGLGTYLSILLWCYYLSAGSILIALIMLARTLK